MLDLLTNFVSELRSAGLPVSIQEAIDAAVAISAVDWSKRAEFKAALGATLVKSASHWPIFDTTFEAYFHLRHDAPGFVDGDGLLTDDFADNVEMLGEGQLDGIDFLDQLDEPTLRRLIAHALQSGDLAKLRGVARLAVAFYGKVDAARPVGASYYLARTMRALDLETIVASLRTPGSPYEDVALNDQLGQLGVLGDRLVDEEHALRVAKLRSFVESEIQRLLARARGTEALVASLRRPLIEDIEFMHASTTELAQMRRAVYPLARVLAARLARRRRHEHKGPLDVRATIRRSLSTGGVPLDLRFRNPHPSRPEIFVVADISGSVSSFARFTLHLVYALGAQFSNVRSFVFVDGLDEVTNIFKHSSGIAEAIQRIATEADVVDVDGHSNYGRVFLALADRYSSEITAKTNVLILGDARNNYHPAEAWVLGDLRRKARRLYFLNPEPRAYWGSGDSIVHTYGHHCDGVYECRNLRQLERFIAQLS